MRTSIDNTKRVFQIIKKGSGQYFCNLSEMPNIFKLEIKPDDDFEVNEVWNNKLKKCSKKHVNEMFEEAKIDFKI